MKSIGFWNELVELDAPVLGDALEVSGISTVTRVHRNSTTPLFILGKNLMVKATGEADGALVKWISLVMQPGVFDGNETALKCDDLDVEILGLATPFSAQDLLRHLEAKGISGLRLSSSIGRWTLSIGPLAFLFFSDRPLESDPEESALATVTYHYGLGRSDDGAKYKIRCVTA